jgi:hypothetical protein
MLNDPKATYVWLPATANRLPRDLSVPVDEALSPQLIEAV